MPQYKWPAIGVGTLVLVITMWFGLLTARTAPVTAVAMIAVGLVFAMYAVAGFSRVPDPMQVGFRASLYALVTGIGLLLAYQGTGNASFVIVAPIASAGVGGSFALVPIGDRSRGLARQGGAIVAAVLMSYVFQVDEVIYALIAPLVPLPVLGIADRFVDRGRDIIAEEPDAPEEA